MLKALGHSTVWLGLLTFIGFALVGTILFGSALSDPSTWLSLAIYCIAAAAVSVVQPHLQRLPVLPRMICWFGLGATAGGAIVLANGAPHDWIFAAFFGTACAAISAIPRNSDTTTDY